MDVKIVGDDPLAYKKVAMNCDHRLDTDALRFPMALQSFVSGFNLLINGSSGSGKTNLLVSLLKSRPDHKKGLRRSFKRIFDNVIIVSPSLKSLKDPVFKGLKHKYTQFTDEVLDEIVAILEDVDSSDSDSDESPEKTKTLLVLDDCGSYLKGAIERRFNHLVKNRRHTPSTLSIICLVQKFKDASTTHRANLTHFITFKPRNEMEMTSIYDEMIGQPKKYMHEIMNGIFNKRFNHLMVDFTQHHGQGGFMYYSNFRPIEFVPK